MEIVCLDLEGVLIPEIWIAFAEKTGIQELFATTRDIQDYDELMTMRLETLKKHGLGLPQIEEVINTLEPLEGAKAFVKWIQSNFQLIILSDTFYEFSRPLMKKLDFPTLFCHRLIVDDSGMITDYKLRQPNQKQKAVEALKSLNFTVYAAGDSYNDTTMLGAADAGFLLHAPDNVISEFAQFPSLCLLYTSPSPRDRQKSRMPSSA